jgi:MFS family permease
MLIPELPAFLTSLNGAEHKGLIISLFTLTAMISRPFSGKLADSIGRVSVMVVGAAVCMVCSVLYPMLTTVFGFFALRFVHGFSTGFTPTGQSAYVSDVIPVDRRGEAMGILGTVGSLGMVAGPGIGGWVAFHFGLNTMFYLSSVFGLVSVLIVIGMKETLVARKTFRLSTLKIGRSDLFEPRVLLPCIIMALSMYAYGVVLTLFPDLGESVGIERRDRLFTYFLSTSLLIRLVAGKASDRYGRVPVLVVATSLVMISMLMIAVAETQPLLIAGVLLYGIAQGGTSPTLLAWATDLSEASHRGRALASLYIFMELGIGLGAYISGWLIGHNSMGFFLPFVVSSVLGGMAFVILLMRPLFSRT